MFHRQRVSQKNTCQRNGFTTHTYSLRGKRAPSARHSMWNTELNVLHVLLYEYTSVHFDSAALLGVSWSTILLNCNPTTISLYDYVIQIVYLFLCCSMATTHDGDSFVLPFGRTVYRLFFVEILPQSLISVQVVKGLNFGIQILFECILFTSAKILTAGVSPTANHTGAYVFKPELCFRSYSVRYSFCAHAGQSLQHTATGRVKRWTARMYIHTTLLKLPSDSSYFRKQRALYTICRQRTGTQAL